jgi:hypothetical protein
MKLLFLFSCTLIHPLISNGQEKISIKLLANHKWINSNFDDCTRYYHFESNGKFEHWNCSMEVFETGKYEIQNDTLTVFEYHLKSEIPKQFGGERGTEIRFQYNYILKDGFLCQVYYRDYKNCYESFEVNRDRRYKREKKTMIIH